MKIGDKSGELSVDKDKTIGCDDPKRFNLDYDVKISDGELESIGHVTIELWHNYLSLDKFEIISFRFPSKLVI